MSGKRRGEVLKLRWEDVDLERGLVTFKGMNTKNKKRQTLPVNEGCLTVLKRALELAKSELVFPCSTGKFFHSFDSTWQRFKKKHGFTGFRLHDLRHTFASHLASSGKVDLYTLQNLLGHRTSQMTQRYAHLIDDALRRGASVADEVFSNYL